MRKKIVYILSHPIQYYAPLFKYLSVGDKIICEVWYLSDHGVIHQLDDEFGVEFKWDIPLLEGYYYRFIRNNSLKPGVFKGFFGFINWQLIPMLFKLPRRSIIVVPGWNSLSYVMAIITGKLFGHVMCMRGDPPYHHELLKGKKARLLRTIAFRWILFPCIHKFLFVGKQNEKFYRHYGVRSEKLIFTPHAVDNNFFKEQHQILLPNRNKLREAKQIPKDHTVILFCGKLIDKKNPLDLLKAFYLLPDGIKATLIFVGEGELRSEIEENMKDSEVKRVVLAGFVNQSKISEYYEVADIFVMCSGEGETWGLSTNEAMNFGLPVLVSDLTGNAPDLVKGNGFVFETNNIEQLQSRLTEMICSSPQQHAVWKENSYTIIESYSYNAIEKGLYSI